MSLPKRKSPRLKDYVYSLAGGYFVTICTHNKQHLFGQVKDEAMLLTKLGTIASEHWAKTPQFFPSVTLRDFVVMPNHVHMILFLAESIDNKPTLGAIIGR